MYKAPTLPTAAFYATSAQTQPKRQSQVPCNYYTTNIKKMSTGNFVADKNSDPALLYFSLKNNLPKSDLLLGGLISLSFQDG